MFESDSFESLVTRILEREYNDWVYVQGCIDNFEGQERIDLLNLSVENKWPLSLEYRKEVGGNIGTVLGLDGLDEIEVFNEGSLDHFEGVLDLYVYYYISNYFCVDDIEGISFLRPGQQWSGVENLHLKVKECFEQFMEDFMGLFTCGVFDNLSGINIKYYSEWSGYADYSMLFFMFLDGDVESICLEGGGVDLDGKVKCWNPSLELLSLVDVDIEREVLLDVLRKKRLPRLKEFVWNNHWYQKDDGLVKHLCLEGFNFTKLDLGRTELKSQSYDYILRSGFRNSLQELRISKGRRSKSFTCFLESIQDPEIFPSLKEYSIGEDSFVKVDGEWQEVEKEEVQEEFFICY